METHPINTETPGCRILEAYLTGKVGTQHTAKVARRYSARLPHCRKISGLTDSGQLTVVAIDIEDDKELWEKTKDRVPQK